MNTVCDVYTAPPVARKGRDGSKRMSEPRLRLTLLKTGGRCECTTTLKAAAQQVDFDEL
jgi:hypothetical protein